MKEQVLTIKSVGEVRLTILTPKGPALADGKEFVPCGILYGLEDTTFDEINQLIKPLKGPNTNVAIAGKLSKAEVIKRLSGSYTIPSTTPIKLRYIPYKDDMLTLMSIIGFRDLEPGHDWRKVVHKDGSCYYVLKGSETTDEG